LLEFKDPYPISSFSDTDQEGFFAGLGMENYQNRAVLGIFPQAAETDFQQPEALRKRSVLVLKSGEQIQHQGRDPSGSWLLQHGGHLITGECPGYPDPFQGCVQSQFPASELPVQG
jgi:hypothetical protein